MKYFLLVFVLSSTVFAKVESLTVKKVLGSSDKAIVAQQNGDEWLIEKGVGCLGLYRYEGKTVHGSFSIDPNSVGAKLILPDGSECRIWSAERAN